MKIIKWDDLIHQPSGTIYSPVIEGRYADGLCKKGDTYGNGWWHRELLPQRTASATLPDFQPETWCPRSACEPADPVHVYEPADIARIISELGARTGNGGDD
jgi:hypothetical protein